jgi:cell volume regulation protein A
VKDLALPEGVVIAVVAREQQMIPPHGHTTIQAGDHVILVLRPGTRALVDRVFAGSAKGHGELPHLFEFPLRGSTLVGELQEMYGIAMNAPASSTLDQLLRDRLGGAESLLGQTASFGPIALHIRELTPDGRVQQVGMIIKPFAEPEEPDSGEDGEAGTGPEHDDGKVPSPDERIGSEAPGSPRTAS